MSSMHELIEGLETEVGIPEATRMTTVDEAAARSFAKAIGAPERYDREGRLLAPATFVTRLVSLDRAGWYVEMGNLHILHAGERCELRRPVRVGERLAWCSRIESVTEKVGRHGRRFWLIVSRYPIASLSEGDLVAEIWRTRAVLDDEGAKA
jgi:hypothetical protein